MITKFVIVVLIVFCALILISEARNGSRKSKPSSGSSRKSSYPKNNSGNSRATTTKHNSGSQSSNKPIPSHDIGVQTSNVRPTHNHASPIGNPNSGYGKSATSSKTFNTASAAPSNTRTNLPYSTGTQSYVPHVPHVPSVPHFPKSPQAPSAPSGSHIGWKVTPQNTGGSNSASVGHQVCVTFDMYFSKKRSNSLK